MKDTSARSVLARAILPALLLPLPGVADGQQAPDPNFGTEVARPAYTKRRPKVLFDEAHNNFHTTTGRYQGFVGLVSDDGYRVVPNGEKFSGEVLKGYDVLLIANALNASGDADDPLEDRPAFTEAECDAVRDWVRAGGALLLIADHTPWGAAARNLAERFDVDMSNSYARDPSNYDQDFGALSWVIYSRGNRNLGDHPITRGRNPSERINTVETFTGQSLKGPSGSVAFLKLSDTATDEPPSPRDAKVKAPRTSAAGRAQGIALRFGKGRVVVLGEAAMLSAQIAGSGEEKYRLGMNRSCIDNRQLALNIMHWLSGLLK
jgi:hypothetical protein